MICKEVSDRIRGCLLGGAAGDALGYPVEFLWIDDIRKRYGPGGIQSYDFDGRTGKALISDDTQMTLFTAEGILSGLTQNRLNGTAIPLRKYVESAYADWLSTQRLGAQPPQHLHAVLGIGVPHHRKGPIIQKQLIDQQGAAPVLFHHQRQQPLTGRKFRSGKITDGVWVGNQRRVKARGIQPLRQSVHGIHFLFSSFNHIC